jgi:hypothetical protein
MSAPYRICRPLSRAQRAALPATQSPDTYAARLLKLVPVEVIVLYLAGRGVILADEAPIAGMVQGTALLLWAILGLLGVIALRWWGTADRAGGESPQKVGVGIAAISYLVWLYSLGDVFADRGIHDARLAALVVIGWTFAAPLLYLGSRPNVAVLPAGGALV